MNIATDRGDRGWTEKILTREDVVHYAAEALLEMCDEVFLLAASTSLLLLLLELTLKLVLWDEVSVADLIDADLRD